MISAIIHMNASLGAALEICVHPFLNVFHRCSQIWLSAVVIMNVDRGMQGRVTRELDLLIYKAAAVTMYAQFPASAKVIKPKETTVIAGVNVRVKIACITSAIS